MTYGKKCSNCGHKTADPNYFGTKPNPPTNEKTELTNGDYEINCDIETNLEVAQCFSDIDFQDT